MDANAPRPARLPLRDDIIEPDLSRLIVGGLYHVHGTLGFGFAEPVYTRSMEVALCQRGLRVQREVPIEVVFEGVEVGKYRIDMLVEDRIILEIKASEKLTDVPKVQLRNYLRAANKRLGLVLHFGPKAAFYRVLNPHS
jgi:GxxExxY protein